MLPDFKPSLKGRFPFRLSVPSYVYPADYVTNVRQLGNHVDEIELLVLEGRADALPTRFEIDRLADLSQRLDISFNVHLPLDLDPGAGDHRQQRKWVECMASAMERVRPLSPTTHTLHLPYVDVTSSKKSVERWQQCMQTNISRLLELSKVTPGDLSIETLDYPPDWFAPIVQNLDLAICVDIGHVLRYGYDLPTILSRFAARTTILHLHGAANGKDHLRLAVLPPQTLTIITQYLRAFKGSVSVEVFSLGALQASLECLVAIMGAAFFDKGTAAAAT